VSFGFRVSRGGDEGTGLNMDGQEGQDGVCERGIGEGGNVRAGGRWGR